MIALGIILLLIILLLILPVGADAAYTGGELALKVKIGPFRLGILPAKKKAEGEKKPKKKPKVKKAKKAEAAAEGKANKKSAKPKQKLTFDDIMGIVRLGLEALGRFRRSISVDLLKLHITAAGSDPYSAVMNYGYINAAIGALLPLLHKVFKFKKEDYDSRIDFEAEKLGIDAHLVMSVRIGEILLIVICAAFGFLKWLLRRKRRAKAEAKAAAAKEKITENSSAEKGT